MVFVTCVDTFLGTMRSKTTPVKLNELSFIQPWAAMGDVQQVTMTIFITMGGRILRSPEREHYVDHRNKTSSPTKTQSTTSQLQRSATGCQESSRSGTRSGRIVRLPKRFQDYLHPYHKYQ